VPVNKIIVIIKRGFGHNSEPNPLCKNVLMAFWSLISLCINSAFLKPGRCLINMLSRLGWILKKLKKKFFNRLNRLDIYDKIPLPKIVGNGF
jgi:hypothetical protein